MPTADTWHDVTTFGSGWGNFGDLTFGKPQYTKDAMGFVHLRGLVAPVGTPASQSTIFTLPAGYTPTSVTGTSGQIFIVTGADTATEIRIDSAGNIKWWAGPTSWISLTGIVFPAF
jgi:hypothetical protein